jgi:hypothetical protein
MKGVASMQTETKEVNLAEEYVKISNSGEAEGMTWDDFFKRFKVAKKYRSNFAVASILRQAQEIIDKEGKQSHAPM